MATSEEAHPDQLADVVARLRRALRRSMRIDLPQESLPTAQVEVLQLLTDCPGLRAGEIGDRLRLAPTTVSTLVGQLLEWDALERRPDPDDRRAWHLHLTPVGEVQLARWQELNESVLHGALTALSVADRRAIERAVPALDRLIARLHDTA